MSAPEVPFRLETAGPFGHGPGRRVLAVGRTTGGSDLVSMQARWGDIVASGTRPDPAADDALAAGLAAALAEREAAAPVARAGRAAWPNAPRPPVDGTASPAVHGDAASVTASPSPSSQPLPDPRGAASGDASPVTRPAAPDGAAGRGREAQQLPAGGAPDASAPPAGLRGQAALDAIRNAESAQKASRRGYRGRHTRKAATPGYGAGMNRRGGAP